MFFFETLFFSAKDHDEAGMCNCIATNAKTCENFKTRFLNIDSSDDASDEEKCGSGMFDADMLQNEHVSWSKQTSPTDAYAHTMGNNVKCASDFDTPLSVEEHIEYIHGDEVVSNVIYEYAQVQALAEDPTIAAVEDDFEEVEPMNTFFAGVVGECGTSGHVHLLPADGNRLLQVSRSSGKVRSATSTQTCADVSTDDFTFIHSDLLHLLMSVYVETDSCNACSLKTGYAIGVDGKRLLHA